MNILKSVTICLLSIAPLSIAEISQSREQHKIDINSASDGHGQFCESWLIENNIKRSGDIFKWDYKENIVSMNIDGKVIQFYPISRRKISKKREVSTYKGDNFHLRIDSKDISTPKGLKSCSMLHEETVTISTDAWKKVMLLKIGCDPCG